MWFGSSPSCEKELPRRSRVFTLSGTAGPRWDLNVGIPSIPGCRWTSSSHRRDHYCKIYKSKPHTPFGNYNNTQQQPDLGRTKRKRCKLTFMFQLQGCKSACTTCAGRRNSPMADPIFGSKYGPQMGSRIGSHVHSFF